MVTGWALADAGELKTVRTLGAGSMGRTGNRGIGITTSAVSRNDAVLISVQDTTGRVAIARL